MVKVFRDRGEDSNGHFESSQGDFDSFVGGGEVPREIVEALWKNVKVLREVVEVYGKAVSFLPLAEKL